MGFIGTGFGLGADDLYELVKVYLAGHFGQKVFDVTIAATGNGQEKKGRSQNVGEDRAGGIFGSRRFGGWGFLGKYRLPLVVVQKGAVGRLILAKGYRFLRPTKDKWY
jgi:hypothetical protein